jgi:hypothetical protein
MPSNPAATPLPHPEIATVVTPRPLLANPLLWLAGAVLVGASLGLVLLLRRRAQALAHTSLITSSIDRQKRK